jgi:hypothetical protein
MIKKTRTSNPRAARPKMSAVHSRNACPTRLPLVLFLLALPPAVQAGDYTYTTNSGTIAITGNSGPGGAVIIPSTIDGLPVTSIGVNAFRYCRSLAGVTIGTNVTTIEG